MEIQVRILSRGIKIIKNESFFFFILDLQIQQYLHVKRRVFNDAT
jgi:hypothetical protein